MAVAEHMETNIHYHAVLKTPNPEKFKAIAETFWTGHVASGHIHFSEMGEIEGWADYMSKELMKGNNWEAIYMSEAKERPKQDK